MPRQFKNARLIKKLKTSQAMELLGVSQPTLSGWEGGRKSPSIEKLELMADVYDTTTDYLLGRCENNISDFGHEMIDMEKLKIMHGKPVFSRVHGWLLVNAIEKVLIKANGKKIPFQDAGELFLAPPAFYAGDLPSGAILDLTEIRRMKSVWVEPVSPDETLRQELRGRYRVKDRYVENDAGNRFFLDKYKVNWLGFEDMA